MCEGPGAVTPIGTGGGWWAPGGGGRCYLMKTGFPFWKRWVGTATRQCERANILRRPLAAVMRADLSSRVPGTSPCSVLQDIGRGGPSGAGLLLRRGSLGENLQRSAREGLCGKLTSLEHFHGATPSASPHLRVSTTPPSASPPPQTGLTYGGQTHFVIRGPSSGSF